MTQKIQKNKNEIGKFYEERALELLLARGFLLLKKDFRVPLSDGWAPVQIDILMRRLDVLWIIEVKSSSVLGQDGSSPLLSSSQRKRLYQARGVLAWKYRQKLAVLLLWFGPSGQVEFLENP